MKLSKRLFSPVAALLLIGVMAGLGRAAYIGHKDPDMPVFLSVYPDAKGTAIDDCATCHRTGEAPVPGDPLGRTAQVNSCDFCHAAMKMNNGKPLNTLNPFGREFMRHGRSAAALKGMAALDSDGDGVSNADEIAARTLPGDPDSVPSMPLAPSVTLTLDQMIKSLAVIDVPLFMNVSKSPDGDRYDDLRGFLLIDVLKAAGMSESATSVDVISVDGYAKTFTIEQLRVMYPQSAPVFGLGEKELGECWIVKYFAKGLVEGAPLPPAGVMLTYEMNGEPYDSAIMVPETGKLRGSGPLRVTGPQMIQPGPPDLSSKAPESCNDVVPRVYQYHRDGYEKNSDYCVKAVVALRVNPMPKGMRAPHWQPDAMKHISGRSLIVYGALDKKN
jgi:hypothetical protein